MTQKKALLISYLYPPISGMAPRRMRTFGNELMKKGYEIHVLTCNPMPNHPRITTDNLANELLSEKQVIFRAYQGIFARFIRSLPGMLNDDIKESSNHCFRPLIQKFIKSCLIPDSKIDWSFFAINHARQHLKNYHYSLIISHGYPMSCHIVALFLKTFYFKEAKWIADYGEPWSFNYELHDMPFWRRTLDRWLEAKCLRKTDLIFVNTEKTREEYLKNFSFISKNDISVIPSCFTRLQDYDVSRDRNNQMVIVYTGNFYSKLQDPFKFIDAVAELRDCQIKVVIAGTIDDKYKEYVSSQGLDNIIEFVGFKKRNEIIKLQRQADVLLLLGALNSVQVPSKIYEYMAAGRPILCIRFDQDDVAAQLVKKYERGIIANNEVEEIKNALEYLYNKWINKEIDSLFNLSKLYQFSQEGIEDKIGKIFRDIIN